MSLKLEDYDLHCVLGRVAINKSYVMKSKLNNKLYVWKPLDYGDLSEENKKLIVSEINLILKLNHPNIVKYYNYTLCLDTILYMVSAWHGEDLDTIIKQCKSCSQNIAEKLIWRVLYQVSKAVQVFRTELKDLTVLSFEIKPENIILDSENNCRLGNFGLAKNEKNKSVARDGTSKDSKLGDAKGDTMTTKSDVFYLGQLVYQMCTLTSSFDNIVVSTFLNTETEKRLEISSFYSDGLRNLMSLMFNGEKKNLTSVDIILYHPLVLLNAKCSLNDINPSDSKILNNLDIAADDDDDDKKICEMLKRKWFIKVSTIRETESKLKLREREIEKREKALIEREKSLKLLQIEVEEKLKLARAREGSGKRTKQPLLQQNYQQNDSEYATDDINIPPTIAKIDKLPKPNFHGRKFIANESRTSNTMRMKEKASCSSKLLNHSSEEQITWSECKKRHQRAMLLQQPDKILVTPNYYHDKTDETFRLVNFSNI